MTGPAGLVPQDPFDLPEWLAEGDVLWVPESGVRTGHLVRGTLTGAGDDLPCDLLALDEAWPGPVAEEDARRRAHQAWRHGQVDVVRREERLTLAVPGTSFTADRVLDVLERLARAVGADPDRYAARLRIGAERRS
ncbi:hypothetical protein [Nocardioides marmotae]|uniref:Uncharacterized protein n=1 Tax=Nocardioides marmotae TaxID=2663857 RepID=A0A6I3J0C5_9ACTN|nr:hypothetical protein [Nocardioides marmotae]MCR6030854.1 hypothetical protein [Gordonia jinghuaiqii]MBC9733881.1 hypothetical protein [Nocardioides marmotae]MTB84984.1 hypothetical protein [Nocardioides marmotae]MTB94491.1 hypothetical protein [Nocardioides marmotae]QKE01489.1 hypothetical protein HPC71_10690 [Nocardioides marmotae]